MAEHHEQVESTGGGFMMGLAAGAVLGAGLALLFAPKAGAQLRQQLRARANEAADRAGQIAGQGRDLAQRGLDLVEQGREAGAEIYDRARGAVSRT